MDAHAMLRTTLAVIFVLGLSVPAAVAQVPVTACATSVSNGFLTGDLDCSATQVPALTIVDGGVLDLAGFTLTGGTSSAIICEGDCTVTGNNGRITGADADGIAASVGTATVSDVTINENDNGIDGVTGRRSGATIVATDVIVTNNARWGIMGRDVTVENSTINGHRLEGVLGMKRAVVRNSSVSGNGRSGIANWDRGTLEIQNCVVQGNGFELSGSGLSSAGRVTVSGTEVTGNYHGGAYARKLRVDTSVFSGNAAAGSECGPDDCADLTAHRLRFEGDSCETSRKLESSSFVPTSETFGVCSSD